MRRAADITGFSVTCADFINFSLLFVCYASAEDFAVKEMIRSESKACSFLEESNVRGGLVGKWKKSVILIIQIFLLVCL